MHGRPVLRLGMRRLLGDPPGTSYLGGIGPPESLEIVDRGAAMRAIRAVVDRWGLVTIEVIGGLRTRVLARGSDAVAELEGDEASSSSGNGHWWLRHVHWSSPTGGAHLVHHADWDGQDLNLIG